MKKNSKAGNRQKKIIQKATCFLLTFALMTTGLPVREISEFASQFKFINSIYAVLPDFEGWDGFRGILFRESELSASAVEADENTDRSAKTINITSKGDLIAYANGTYNSNGVSGYRHDDTLIISFNDQSLDIKHGDSFPGIGTSVAPFSGQIQIGNVSSEAPYGEFKKLSLNNVSLFNYISTDAQFINTGGEATPLLLNAVGEGTAPLFANHVTSGSSPKEWDIVVNANNYQTGGLIGSIGSIDENANANISVSYLSSGPVSSSGDAGTICGTMGQNSSLMLSVNSECANTDGTNASCAGLGNVSGATNAGGLIGSMGSGATLKINALPTFSTARTINATGGYAGGLVGKCDGGTVTFSGEVKYTDNGSNTITGTSGAGGVFGYYGVAAGETVEIDSGVYSVTGTNKIKASEQSAGGLIGVLENKGTDALPSSITISGGNIKSTLNSSNSGGLIGKYIGTKLVNTLTISGVTTDSSRTNGTYGGLIGYMAYAYVRTEGTNTLTVYATDGNSGGLVGTIDNSFLDVAGENTFSGTIRAGILHTMSNNSVIRLAGKTDLKGMTDIKQANLIQNRQNSLVYALGSGTDYNAETGTGWSYYRPDKNTSTLEDVNAWGQVVRLVQYLDKNEELTTGTLEEAGVVTVDLEAHTVKLYGIEPTENTISIANSADFAKVALNIQLNTGTSAKSTGAFLTTEDILTKDILNNSNVTIKITNDVDLTATGIRGFTRDSTSDDKDTGVQNAFLGTLDGGGHKITIAIGEAYGYRGDSIAVNEIGGNNGNTGAVCGHKRFGLFVKVGGTIKDLTVDGCMYAYMQNVEFKSGVLAAQLVSALNLTNVKTEVQISVKANGSQFAVGSFIGMDEGDSTTSKKNDDWKDTSNANITITECEVNHNIMIYGSDKNAAFAESVGMISRIQGKSENVTVDGLKISGTITNEIDNFSGYGGLFGLTQQQKMGSTSSDTFIQNITLKNIQVEDFTIEDNSKNTRSVGVLGGYWHSVNVIIGDDDTHSNGLTVKNSSVNLNGNKSKMVGGLVTNSTGFWQINDLNYDNFKIEKGASNTNNPSLIGLIVGQGSQYGAEQTDASHRLYLEITSPEAYTITNGDPFEGNATIYDEIVGRTIISDDIGGSQEGLVSIRTTNNVLNMMEGSGNEYQPKTTLGKTTANKYTRYYYNLDYLLAKEDKTGGEKALLWSVYNYTSNNIRNSGTDKHGKKIKELHSSSFDDYNTFPTEEDINLENLSYYPIDVSSDVSLSDKTITLNHSAMQAAHGTQYSTVKPSQHYMMHAGLFRNVTSNLSVSNMTLCGNVGVYQDDSGNDLGSGALVCGTVSGSSDAKASVTVEKLKLSDLNVHDFTDSNNNCALLIRKIGDYSSTSVSGVSTVGYSTAESSTPQAAQSLIGEAIGTQMSVVFSDMRLDGRSSHDSVSDSDAQTAMDTAYHTCNSIFSEATLIKTLKYDSTQGSSAIYNYNYAEDWKEDGTPLHHVTYGKEISNSLEFVPDAGDDDQRRYLDMHAIDDQNHWTSPVSSNATSVYDFSSGFLPYVSSSFDSNSTTGIVNHEIAVNHISVQIEKGCGTYNDPYIIEDGTILSAVAKALSTANFSKGFGLYIDKDYLDSYNVNFAKWDSDKNGGTNHTRYEFDGSSFVGMMWDADNEEWVEDSTITKCPTTAQVLAYLAGAYYQITGTEGNHNAITLSESYPGLGAENSDYAFRGVIVGKSAVDGDKVTVKNQSEAPFIKVSNGCVVKDIVVNITADTITLTNSNISTAAKFDYNSGCKYYGGVIGEIMGGDSVIDGVNVTFGDNENNTTAIKIVSGANGNDYQYTQIVPVGGYVGVVVYGGLIFRNMGNQSSGTIGDLTVNSYQYDGTTPISTNAMDASNMAHLYVNPIVGRVINAYVFNETSSYNYTNATATLKNSTKNYAIPDLNKDTANIITFSREENDTVDTIKVPDGQSLFVLSLITQSMCGNATSATAAYKTKYSYGEDTKTTHLAKYNAVGTNVSLQPDDFSDFAIKDKIGDSAAVPYLIAHYTDTTDGNYPARAITGKNTNYRYMKLTGNSDYNLPECFRGIGLVYSLGSDDNVRYNLMYLYGLDGNGKTINLNTKFYNKSCVFDPYYKNSTSTNAFNIGLGLFNDLYADLPKKTTVAETSRSAHSDDVIKDTKNALYNFKLSGTIEHFQYDNDEKVVNANDSTTNNRRACTGGLIGNLSFSGDTTERVYNIWNVSLKDIQITCDGRVGGFFGKLPQKTLYIYINNCDADNLNIETRFNDAGAIVGSLDGNNNIRLFVNTIYEDVNDYKVSVKSETYFSCGGLIGWMKAQYVTLRNINIIGSGDKQIGIKDKTDIQKSSNNTVTNFRTGGAIGYIEGGKVLLDNINVYGVNIYGGHSGGLIGSMNSPTLKIYNCGVHGESYDKVVIEDNETYYIEGYRVAGGIVGYQNNNTTVINYGSITYSNDIDGCHVNKYTIKQYQNSDAGAGGIIASNSSNKTRIIANSMVSDCTIACNGQGENRGMGGIIGLTNGNNGIGVQCYNIAVNNLTFNTTAACDTTTYPTNGVEYPRVKSHYGLFCGRVNNSPVIELVGYTVQGTNTVNVAFYNKLTTCPRNVEFDLGRSYNGDLTSVIPNVYNSSSYIIYADYDGSCLNSDTRKTIFSDQTLATNVSKAVSADDNFPYVTSSPFYTFGTSGKFLTGDGVSESGLAFKHITEQYNDSAYYGAKQYKNIDAGDVKAYQKLIDEGKLVTDDETLPDIPVIIMDSESDIYDTAIKAYLRILTNTKYKFDGTDATGIYNIDTLNCNISGAAPTESSTLYYKNGSFSMNSSEFDSGTAGQFSLIDVQFFAPNDITKTAYHLYVPVITKKLYYYGFKTTVLSGTQYYETKYTEEEGEIGFNGNNPKVLMENYGTPVTQYLRWIYPTDALVSDVLGGGFGLDWHYKKAINITVSYGGKIPAASKLVLIDKNNKNKEYYYTVSGEETYNGQTLTLDFESFRAADGSAPKIVDFQSLVTEQLSFTKATDSESRGAFIEDSENGTFSVKIDGTETKVRLAVADDSDESTFNLSAVQSAINEDYYLTIYSEEEPGVLYHQLQITSTDPLTPNKTGKISSKGNDLHSAQINLANLFSNEVSVTTVEEDSNTNIEMNDMNKDVGVHVTSVIKFNNNDPTTINNLKALLKTNNISIYHSTHVYMNKRSTNDGAAEKVIGDIDSIVKETKNNTITAYSTYKEDAPEQNVEITDPVKMSYSDVNGGAVTNFFEVREMNTEGGDKKAIDLSDYLTSGGTDVAPTVVIDSCFKINYSHAGVISQFPEREKSDDTSNIGTYVSARSSLAYSPSDTTYSSNVSESKNDSANRLYYRYQMTDADLKFNVYQKETDAAEEVSGDIVTKANDQLGINIFDNGTDTNSVIRTKGVFDASQLSALENKNLKIRWTIELRCKQDGYQEEDDLKLLDYLNKIEVKDAKENTLATLSSSLDVGTMISDGTKWYYQDDSDKFKEDDNVGLFDIYLDFNVKTGADLQKVENAFYSNYMIVLTASLCEGTTVIDGTSDDDYLIYTNARLDPSFVNAKE